ncbi:glutamate--tRNA ligase [Luteibaculum oceani]|uniref:Glutamate--tRNA ligase n=1 Tax=Luteibaculum oceani TaxID=1294296 RepID=A0A5C6VPU1_9FLAO|nr:glutamate--tRNA ligase [Luteibaculum oceani]TXC85368.1 glutamate--tRNA ligase [Luteibaculum oceani]
MADKVRVRFAPSPTGPLHMGGVRTALYNYLFAKKHGGDFILRIEDTDQTRYVPGAEDYIVEALKWSGIAPDEGQGFGGSFGPYRQSERKDLYYQYAQQLVDSGNAYYAFDTAEELEEMRERLKKAKVAAPQYNAVTRGSMKNSVSLSAEEVEKRLENGDPYVIRLKVPRNEEIRFFDEIRGWVVVHSSNLDDKVLFKSDGMPTYHLANIVDDHLMKITHVIRGEEWLPSAPTHILLYKFLEWEAPKMAHLPLILKPDGNGKLSKRDGDRLGFPVFPIDWIDPISGEKSSGYREKGYYPEAFVNMLAFLGWNPGTEQEIFSLAELVDAFSIERVGKSGSKFDPEKTKWFNQQWLRKQSDDNLVTALKPILEKENLDIPSYEFLKGYVSLMKERAQFPTDLLEGKYLLTEPQEYDAKTIKKKWKENTPELMGKLAEVLRGVEDFSAENIETAFKKFLEDQNVGMGAVLPNFRVLVTGMGMGPSMFQISELLGKDPVLKRIEEGITKLSN